MSQYSKKPGLWSTGVTPHGVRQPQRRGQAQQLLAQIPEGISACVLVGLITCIGRQKIPSLGIVVESSDEIGEQLPGQLRIFLGEVLLFRDVLSDVKQLQPTMPVPDELVTALAYGRMGRQGQTGLGIV